MFWNCRLAHQQVFPTGWQTNRQCDRRNPMCIIDNIGLKWMLTVFLEQCQICAKFKGETGSPIIVSMVETIIVAQYPPRITPFRCVYASTIHWGSLSYLNMRPPPIEAGLPNLWDIAGSERIFRSLEADCVGIKKVEMLVHSER